MCSDFSQNDHFGFHLTFFSKSLKLNRHQNSVLVFEDKDQIMARMKNGVGEKIDVATQRKESGILPLSPKEHDWPRYPMFSTSRKGVFGPLRRKRTMRRISD